MELTFDHDLWLGPARDSKGPASLRTGRIEWPALAARLAAAHAYQRHSAKKAAVEDLSFEEGPMGQGSFHAVGANRLFDLFVAGGARVGANGGHGLLGDINNPGGMERSDVVNPTSSADFKDTSCNGSGVAGPIATGNRGLK